MSMDKNDKHNKIIENIFATKLYLNLSMNEYVSTYEGKYV